MAIYYLIKLYLQYKRGMMNSDEWMGESERVLKESLQDKVNVARGEIWGA